MKLPTYIKNALGLFERGDVINTSDLIKRLELAANRLKSNEEAFLSLKTIKEKDLDKQKVRATLDYFIFIGIKAKSLREGVGGALTSIKDFTEFAQKLIEEIDDEGSSHYVMDTLSPRQSAILLFGQRIVNVSEILTQLALVVVHTLTSKGKFIYKSKRADVVTALKDNALTISSLDRKTGIKMLAEIHKLSNEPKPKADELSVNDSMFRVRGANNFTGNPIYHTRRWWADIEFEAHEKDKYERKLLALKLAELQMVANDAGELDVRTQEQIEYYEEEIGTLDMRIEEFRNE